MPMNTTGGLIGWGHPTGATGVHQAVTIWQQLTGKAGKAQIKISDDRPYGMTINMGGGLNIFKKDWRLGNTWIKIVMIYIYLKK